MVAQRTREGSTSMDEFLRGFDGRIQAMANAHALLSRSRWQGASLAELVHKELAPCVARGNTSVEGPHVLLSPAATQPMAIVLHELVTNASKYGALTKPHGRIAVRWTLQRDGDGRRILVLEWVETGGPTVVVPDQPGYGTGAIRNLIPYELSGRVDLAFDAAGVRCRIELPAKRSREGTETIDLFKVPVPLQAPAQSEAQSP
jgi:two-component sensor histidine kinase